jgi:hypothetical protein
MAVTPNPPSHLLATCRCGTVQLEAIGRPIVTGSCYCSDCQEAGHALEQLPAAPALLNADGGTDAVLVRKDRVRCVAGEDRLEEHRLKPDSPTRRVVATCCNSAMFLDFARGHWLSLYRNRFAADAPPIDMRIMTKHRRIGVTLADDVPNHDGFSAGLMLKFLAAWIAMGFRRPDVPWGKIKRR